MSAIDSIRFNGRIIQTNIISLKGSKTSELILTGFSVCIRHFQVHDVITQIMYFDFFPPFRIYLILLWSSGSLQMASYHLRSFTWQDRQELLKHPDTEKRAHQSPLSTQNKILNAHNFVNFCWILIFFSYCVKKDGQVETYTVFRLVCIFSLFLFQFMTRKVIFWRSVIPNSSYKYSL